MTSEDREHQAAAFLSFHRKRGGPWEETFETWAATKEFSPADQSAIRVIIAELLIADGTTTDPLDWLRTG